MYKTQIPIGGKHCPRCKEFKTLEKFSLRGNGFKSHCKQCDAEKYKAKKEMLIKQFEKPTLWQRVKGWFL